MIDNRTTHFNLPLPNAANLMKTEDVPRLIAALQAIDAAIYGRATAADIDAAINALVDGAPAALDTLNELAAALNDDASFAASMTTALAGKAPTSHTHAIGDVIGLVTALAAKLESVPKATPSVMGGFKLGNGFVQDIDGTLSVVASGGGSGLPAWQDQIFTPTDGQTVFTPSGGYVAGQIDVILNGSTLIGNGDDYTAANGTTVVLTTAVGTVDKIVVRKWFYLPSANAVNKLGDTMTGALNEAHGADIASATSINLNVATGNLIDVTGTTAISTIVLADGAERAVRFTGALTLTHGANLVLPGSANITTAAGDFAILRGYAGGVVRCAVYTRSNGKAVAESAYVGGTLTTSQNEAHGADIASASTINLTTATGNLVDVTGTTTITGITLADGAERTVRFTGALTLTHGASLVLPGAASILTAAGDFAVFRGYAAGVVRCVSYTASVARAGYLNIPPNPKIANYTIVKSDAGKNIRHPNSDTTARTFTIDSNATQNWEDGTAITFQNKNGAGVVTIAVTTDTMRLAGVGTTGNRTLAANGIATAIWDAVASDWTISGTGLS